MKERLKACGWDEVPLDKPRAIRAGAGAGRVASLVRMDRDEAAV